MRYYKNKGAYIATVGVIEGAEEITQEEYEKQMEDTVSRLDNPDPTDSEVLNILLGGDTA